MEKRIRLIVAIVATCLIPLITGQSHAAPAENGPGSVQVASDAYGGYTGLYLGNSSGYFELAESNGRWWLVTPSGHAFFSLGVSTVHPWSAYPQSSYLQNIDALYGGGPERQPWIDVTIDRLQAWGFNTIGGFSWVSVYDKGLPYAVDLDFSCGSGDPSCATAFPMVNKRFPDVFDPRFAASAQAMVQDWDPASGRGISDEWLTDPYLIGYWLDNDLWWWHDWMVIVDARAETVVEDFIEHDCSWAGKTAWVDHLRDRYGNNISALNSAWGTRYGSFGQLCTVYQVTSAGAATDKETFLSKVAQRYFDITVSAVRARDPNHLVLGIRFAESVPDPVLPAASACDALGINYYVGIRPYELPTKFRNTLAHWYNLNGRPVIVAEYSFRSPDTGLPGSRGGAYSVNTRAERADGYRNFFHYAAGSPNLVGLHWFQYVDQPVQGRHDGEDNNTGLVDEADAPYPEMIEAVRDINTYVYDHLLGTGQAPLRVPRLLLPRHSDNLQSAGVTFYWQEVPGATSYNVQISQHPQFPAGATTTYADIAGNTVSHTLPNAGRWYWRVQAVGPGELSPYSAPYPLDLLDVDSVYMLNDFETEYDATVASETNSWFGAWDSWPREAISLQKSDAHGVTSGTYSGQAHYTGLCLYTPCKAALSRFPNGSSFSPHDWSAFDYLAYDIYNPNPNDWSAEVSVFTPAGTSGYYLWDRFAIQGGVQNYFMFDLNQPFHLGSRTNITNFAIELVEPLPDFEIYYDNVRLLDVKADNTPPAPVSFTAYDIGLGAVVALDWSAQSPSPDTVGYRIYVGTNGNCNIGPGLSTPIETVDGAVTNYRARMSFPPTETTNAIPLERDRGYCFTVTALDWRGNESAPIQYETVTPHFAGYIFPALDGFYGQVTDVHGTPVAGALVTCTDGTNHFETVTDSQGRYALWPYAGTYALQATRAGYTASEPTQDLEVLHNTHRQWDIVLTTAANLIDNGGFEGNWQADWAVLETDGGTPIQDGSVMRSGRAALRLGGTSSGASSVGQRLDRTQICGPLISFWYKVSGSDTGDELAVILRHDGEETQLGSLPLIQQGWTYARLRSLSTFTGTLDLILSAVQNRSNSTTVHLDEVALLSSRCDFDNLVYLPLVRND
jgi:hypothetical protein